ncbi:hypothetical protein DVH24_041537, partial [Malus domestica]
PRYDSLARTSRCHKRPSPATKSKSGRKVVNFVHKAGWCLKLPGVDSSSTVVQQGQGWLRFSPEMMGYKAQVVASAIAMPIRWNIEKSGRSTVDFCRLSWSQTVTYPDGDGGGVEKLHRSWPESNLKNERLNWVVWCARVDEMGRDASLIFPLVIFLFPLSDWSLRYRLVCRWDAMG